MPVSVSRRSLFPRAAELIWARFTLSAIAGSPGKQRAGKQAAVLEGKPGVGPGSVGEAHAESFVLSPGASVVAFPVLRGQGKRRQLDLSIGRLGRVRSVSCYHHGYGHGTFAQGVEADPAQHGDFHQILGAGGLVLACDPAAVVVINSR